METNLNTSDIVDDDDLVLCHVIAITIASEELRNSWTRGSKLLK